jgi:hypothetical protein
MYSTNSNHENRQNNGPLLLVSPQEITLTLNSDNSNRSSWFLLVRLIWGVVCFNGGWHGQIIRQVVMPMVKWCFFVSCVLIIIESRHFDTWFHEATFKVYPMHTPHSSFVSIAWSKSLVVHGRQRSSLDFLKESVSIMSPPKRRIATFWLRIRWRFIQSLSNTYAPFIFCLKGMINGINSTWSTWFQLGFSQRVCIHHFATTK